MNAKCPICKSEEVDYFKYKDGNPLERELFEFKKTITYKTMFN